MKHPLRPLRFWMTGCVAVVSLAMVGPRGSRGEERGHSNFNGGGAWQASRFGMAETLRRLEASAHQHGLGVLIRWTPSAGTDIDTGAGVQEMPVVRNAAFDARDGAVLVFEPLASGGTPVVMNGDHAPDLPLSLCVRSRADGQVEVRLPPEASCYNGKFPLEVERKLTELPDLVADALA